MFIVYTFCLLLSSKVVGFRNACIRETYIWCLIYVLICVSVYELLHMYMCYQRCAKKCCESVCQVGEYECGLCLLWTRMMSIVDMICGNIWDV